MKKIAVSLAFICLIFTARSQQITNSPSQMYALGYSIGKSIYDLQHSGPVTPTIATEIGLRQDKYDNTYEYIMETYHSSVTAGALTSGYLNGLAKTGIATISGNNYPSPPSIGGSLDGLIKYDASIMYPLGSPTVTYTNAIDVVPAGGGSMMSVSFVLLDPDTIEIVIHFN